MEDDDNWGLQAVVRSCGAAAASSSCSSACSSSSSSAVAAGGWSGPLFRLPPSKPPSVKEEEDVGILGDHRGLSGLCSAAVYDIDLPLGELEELFRPFFPTPPSHHDPTTPPQVPVAREERTNTPPAPPPAPFPTPSLFAAPTGAGIAGKQPVASRPRGMCTGTTHSGRSKRRKSLVKKVVCQVPAEALCSDIWAWRKYGQKPIKGSPFPRGYYRCSSSKGCPARKQVERSRTDPGMFVITYTSDHNHPVPTHRSCLAGSTRHRSPPPQPTSTGTAPVAPDAAGNPTRSGCGGKPSVSCSPLSSVEDELLLPALPEEEMGVPGLAVAGDTSVVLHTNHDDGLLDVGGGVDVDDMLGGVEQDTDSDDGMLFSAAAAAVAGFCSPPSTPPGPEDGVCSWTDNPANALPFAAASR